MAYIRFPHEILYDILIWNYKKMKKQNKVYNLALKKQINQKIPEGQHQNCLQTITQIPQNKSFQDIPAHGRFINIFQKQRFYKDNFSLKKKQSIYNILCKKEVQAYKSKINKVKSTGNGLRIKISQSFLSSCRHTGTFGELAQNNDFISKQQIRQFYSKAKQNEAFEHQKIRNHLKTERLSNRNCHTISKRHQKFKNTWQTQFDQTNRINKQCKTFSSKLNSSRQGNYSKENSLQSHRKKVQQLISLSLKQQKQNIQPDIWVSNLRQNKLLKDHLNEKYVESIERDGFKIRGHNKLNKQYSWVNQKKYNYFEPIEDKSRFLAKIQKINQQNKILNQISQNILANNASRLINMSNYQ